jgi:hypothetical protein
MIKKIILILFLISSSGFAQEEIDIFIIDSYVTPELPYKIRITFFTSESVKSKIIFKGNKGISVTTDYNEDHNFEIPLESLKYDSTTIPFEIIVEDRNGKMSKSDYFDLYLPEEYNLNIKNNSNMLDLCLGGILYLIPSPTLTNIDNEMNFSLTKEFPVISFYGSGYNFPTSYISLEYSYLFDARNKNYYRVGYKYILQTKTIKYVSPGINFTTNFNEFSGISPEISFGLFKFYETFTLYARYRYNYNFDSPHRDFQELSIGLYTSSISFNF